MTVEREVNFLGLTFKFLEAKPGSVEKVKSTVVEIVSKDELIVKDSASSTQTIFEKEQINEANISLRHRGKAVNYYWNPTEESK